MDQEKPKEKIYKKWWFWILLALFFFIFFMIIGDLNSNTNSSQSQNTATEEVPVIKVTASQLVADYKANQVSADEKYKGKTIEISGTIDTIGKDILDTPYVTLYGGNSVNSVQCMFDKSDTAQLASLVKDTRITLKGKAAGGVFILNVILWDCSIVQ